MEIISLSQILRFAAALAFVLALMGGLALIMRWLGQRQHGGNQTAKRLKVIETLPLDPRRRLMLVQRDGAQHLLILGANGETVIETDIESPHHEALAKEDMK